MLCHFCTGNLILQSLFDTERILKPLWRLLLLRSGESRESESKLNAEILQQCLKSVLLAVNKERLYVEVIKDIY